MNVLLLADVFAPLRSSGAVQLRDFAVEVTRQGHHITVLVASPGLGAPWTIQIQDGVTIVRLRTPATRDMGYVRRTIGEFLMPYAMLFNLNRSPVRTMRWSGIAWYSPTIFLGPLVRILKWRNGCSTYLIIRDIFPEWAVDMGLMGRGLPYRFFDAIARYQYSVADVIGVQTPGNMRYFSRWREQPGRKLEVLQNWLGKPAWMRCSIRVNDTLLAGRKVFVYAGNMGVAQGMDILLDLALRLRSRTDIGFLFVGRGSDADRLRNLARVRQLDNVVFSEEIHPDEIPDLYTQCCAGIVALDSRHKSHNIPGKFLTYMQSGLPVLANVNAGNDLATMIRDEKVGQVCESNRLDDLLRAMDDLVMQIEEDADLKDRCRRLFEREFSVEKAVSQVVAALSR